MYAIHDDFHVRCAHPNKCLAYAWWLRLRRIMQRIGTDVRWMTRECVCARNVLHVFQCVRVRRICLSHSEIDSEKKHCRLSTPIAKARDNFARVLCVRQCDSKSVHSVCVLYEFREGNAPQAVTSAKLPISSLPGGIRDTNRNPNDSVQGDNKSQ